MLDFIQTLDDNTAQKILDRLVKLQPASQADAVAWTPDLKHALTEAFGLPPSPSVTSEKNSRGELARLSLQLLAEDPKTAGAIETMASAESGPQTFDLGASFILTAAVIFALQTRIQFERKSTGEWSVKIDKKASSDSTVKGLAQKLLAFTK